MGEPASKKPAPDVKTTKLLKRNLLNSLYKAKVLLTFVEEEEEAEDEEEEESTEDDEDGVDEEEDENERVWRVPKDKRDDDNGTVTLPLDGIDELNKEEEELKNFFPVSFLRLMNPCLLVLLCLSCRPLLLLRPTTTTEDGEKNEIFRKHEVTKDSLCILLLCNRIRVDKDDNAMVSRIILIGINKARELLFQKKGSLFRQPP